MATLIYTLGPWGIGLRTLHYLHQFYITRGLAPPSLHTLLCKTPDTGHTVHYHTSLGHTPKREGAVRSPPESTLYTHRVFVQSYILAPSTLLPTRVYSPCRLSISRGRYTDCAPPPTPNICVLYNATNVTCQSIFTYGAGIPLPHYTRRYIDCPPSLLPTSMYIDKPI